MRFTENIPCLHGHLEFRVFKNGVEIENWSDHNAIMPDAYTVLAHLLKGDMDYSASSIGVAGGSSETPNAESLAAMRRNSVPVIGSVLASSPNKVQFAFTLDRETCNNVQIQEFGLFCGSSQVMFAHRVRTSTITKTDDMEIAGTWTITFDSPATAVGTN